MSDSLVSEGRLMEAEYGVIFRITSIVDSDGFPFSQFPLYGGSVTTPDGSTVIVMEYVNRIWRLSKLGSPAVSMTLPQKSLTSSLISAEDLSDIVITSNVPTCNTVGTFSSLPEDLDSSSEAYVPTFLSNKRVEGRLQQRFEIMCRLRKEAVTLHRAHQHPNNRTLLVNHDLEAHCILHKHLKRYTLAVSCDACREAIGKRDKENVCGHCHEKTQFCRTEENCQSSAQTLCSTEI